MHRRFTKWVVYDYSFTVTYFLTVIFSSITDYHSFYFYDSFSTGFAKHNGQEAYAADSCNRCITKCPWFTASFKLGLSDKSPALSRKCQPVKGGFIISGPGILGSEGKTGCGMDFFSSVSDTSHNKWYCLSVCRKFFANCLVWEKYTDFQICWFIAVNNAATATNDT